MRKIPTEKQVKTFENLSRAKSLKDAMYMAGYSYTTAATSRRSFLLTKGVQQLIPRHRLELHNVGIDPDTLYDTRKARFDL